MLVFRPRSLILYASITLPVFIACKKNTVADDPVATVLNLPETPYNYAAPVLPAHMSASVMLFQTNTPPNNPITDKVATLGRVLFYDKQLSLNNTISCASCHKQANAFTDPATFSLGFNGGLTRRNSMSLINAKYYFNGSFFWDQRAPTLEAQTLMPIQDLVEMGMTLPALEAKLSALPYYMPLFQKTFGDGQVSRTRIAAALSQFVRSIISYQTRYDVGRSAFPVSPSPQANAQFSNFTLQENRGKEVFFSSALAGCANCHHTDAFTVNDVKNNGLDLTTTDRGFGGVVNNVNFDGTFKVPSLRNVEMTAPYMHDGRFTTLEQVVEHYSNGVQAHPNLSPEIRLPSGMPRQANLSSQDKAAIVAFLKTLTDVTVTTDVKYSNPFK